MATEYTKIGRIRPVFKGAWNSAAAYTILDIVHTADGSRAYAAVKDVPAGTQLTNTAYWQPVIDMQALVSRVEQAEENVSTAVSAVSGKAPAIECSASGSTIGVSDSADAPLLGLKLFGKTTQDGTPSLNAPVELVSAGDDGSIAVTVEGGETDDEQTITLSTPNGLPGIPVTSGGNYTDENGQPWVCDEIDLARGVYIRRVALFEIPFSASKWQKNASSGIAEGLHVYQLNKSFIDNYYSNFKVCACSHAVYTGSWSKNDNSVYAGSNLTFTTSAYTSLDDWLEFVESQSNAGTPIMVLYCLANPVETPLVAEEIAAFKALRTSKPTTNVLNDSGAGMQLNYAADTKTYIDNKFAALAAAMVSNT